MPVRAMKICASLWGSLHQEPGPASLHSAFQHAANLSAGAGMLTLLSPGKGLQPGSAVLERAMDFSRLGAYSLTVGRDGIFADGAKLISFQQAQRMELRPGEALPPPGSESFILNFLRAPGHRACLSGFSGGGQPLGRVPVPPASGLPEGGLVWRGRFRLLRGSAHRRLRPRIDPLLGRLAVRLSGRPPAGFPEGRDGRAPGGDGGGGHQRHQREPAPLGGEGIFFRGHPGAEALSLPRRRGGGTVNRDGAGGQLREQLWM